MNFRFVHPIVIQLQRRIKEFYAVYLLDEAQN